jgi:hypothetical protein
MASRKTSKKTNSKSNVEELGADAVRNAAQAVKNIERELALKAVADRGVIESDDDWFENWKPEVEDLVKCEDAYLKAFSEYIKAKRVLEQARSRANVAYNKAGIEGYNILPHL